MAAPKRFNVASDAWSEIPVLAVCNLLTIGEDNQVGTTDYYWTDDPAAADADASRKASFPSGHKRAFPMPAGLFWQPDGPKPGYLKTVTGSVWFLVEYD